MNCDCELNKMNIELTSNINNTNNSIHIVTFIENETAEASDQL